MESKTENLKKGQRAAFISVLVSLFLAIMKAVVGFFFNSQLLIADAVHSVADLMTHAASGFGLWIAAKGKTNKFPYGLYRAETLACMIVGILISLAGMNLFQEGLEKLFHLETVAAFPIFPIGASLISSVAGFVIAGMESSVGHAIGSQSLIASAKEAYMDIFTSLAVLLGILLAYFHIPYAEGAIIILISILLVKIGVENIWSALLIFLDANLDLELQSEIEEKVKEVNGVKGVDTVKIRQSGPFKMVECIISTRATLTLYKAHAVADKVEEMISQNYEEIESIFIHVEPNKANVLRVVIPVKDGVGLEDTVHKHFARAPYYLTVEIDGTHTPRMISCHVNPYLGKKEHIGVKTSHLVIDQGADLVFTANIGEISYHMLKSHMIDIFQATQGSTIEETVVSYYHEQLKPLAEPMHLIEESQIFKTISNDQDMTPSSSSSS